jgi:hypothetical protein
VKTAKDLFTEIYYIKQLLDTTKLAEDYIVNNSRSSRLKHGCSIGFTGLALGDRI